MAPPPKYLVERKLIRSIVKKVVPQRPLIPTEYFSKLTDCWKKHGIGSSKCSDEEMMYNFVLLKLYRLTTKLFPSRSA
jgi:hypothetical protein